jgi:hypothetical protein
MEKNPYSDLPKSAFWKTGVAHENPYAIEGIYTKKYDIHPNARIATAGSCFAQHISRHLKINGYNLLDVEPPLPELPKNLHQKHGFSMYSARYGNIYTVRQLLQLAQEVAGEWTPKSFIWKKNKRFYDALRPAVEPEGLESEDQVLEHRYFHISRVKELFKNLDLFIFTLGLTEMWMHRDSGTVYPTAPGTLAGEYDEKIYIFKNAQFGEILSDFNRFQETLAKIRGGKPFYVLLTVSPVPLTATASNKHVLVSTNYSKSTLRSVAGQLSANQAHIDYFPSFEIVTNPRNHSTFFSENLRSVRDDAVDIVMKHFFAEHHLAQTRSGRYNELRQQMSLTNLDVQCEESLLEVFEDVTSLPQKNHVVAPCFQEIFGNSHLAGFKSACLGRRVTSQNLFFYPVQWLIDEWANKDYSIPVQINDFDEMHRKYIQAPDSNSIRRGLIFVGMGLMGEGMIQCFGALHAGFIKENGTMPLGSEISPYLPIISSPGQISQDIKEAFAAQLSRIRRIIDKITPYIANSEFTWLSSPMPSETCAIFRFGRAYVESCSQPLYNKIYLDLASSILREFIDSGAVIMQDPHTLAPNGFTQDCFRADEPIFGIHASPQYYSRLLDRLKL